MQKHINGHTHTHAYQSNFVKKKKKKKPTCNVSHLNRSQRFHHQPIKLGVIPRRQHTVLAVMNSQPQRDYCVLCVAPEKSASSRRRLRLLADGVGRRRVAREYSWFAFRFHERRVRAGIAKEVPAHMALREVDSSQADVDLRRGKKRGSHTLAKGVGIL